MVRRGQSACRDGNRGADLINGGDGTDTAERDDSDSRSLIEVLA